MHHRRSPPVPGAIAVVAAGAVLLAGCGGTVRTTAPTAAAGTGGATSAATTRAATTPAPPARPAPTHRSRALPRSSTTPPAPVPPAVPAPAATRAPAPRLLPDRMADTRGSAQLIAVTNSGGGDTATLEAFERVGGRWRPAFPTMPAVIGAQGFSTAVSESTTATPIGLFTLTQAFGTLPDPGTALPYRQSRYGDVWVDDPASPNYNTMQPNDAGLARGSGERLWQETYAYAYAIVIDYNRSPVVPGAGSAFFLHVFASPTAGCVGVTEDRLVALLHWLNPAAHPRIALGPRSAVLGL